MWAWGAQTWGAVDAAEAGGFPDPKVDGGAAFAYAVSVYFLETFERQNTQKMREA